MYQIKRVAIGKSAQLNELAHACGELYSQTLVFFWRTVRHKGIWLKEKHLKQLFTSKQLHAHTSDACVEAFVAALKSWRERRKSDPTAKPPHRRRWYFRIEYKRKAMSVKEGKLILSMVGAMPRWFWIGIGPSRKPWSFAGQGPSTKLLPPMSHAAFLHSKRAIRQLVSI